jgi:sulfonate transport system permease protein
MTGTSLSRHTIQRLIPLIAPFFIIIFGEVAVRLRWVPIAQFPAPSEIIPAICSWPLLQDLGWTCLRVASGVLLGTTIGICTGLYFSQNKPADLMFSLTVRILAPIPIIIWLPFLVIFLGTGEATKIAFVATGAFFLERVS